MLSSGVHARVHDDFFLTFFEEKKQKQTNKQQQQQQKQVKHPRGYHFLRKGGPKYTGVMTMKLSIDAQSLKLSLTDNLDNSLATVYYFRSQFCVDVPKCSKQENE